MNIVFKAHFCYKPNDNKEIDAKNGENNRTHGVIISCAALLFIWLMSIIVQRVQLTSGVIMQTSQQIKEFIATNPATLLYFSAPSCNVCHALKPKLLGAIAESFTEFQSVEIDISIDQEIAASFGVFAIPTLLVFLDGKEFLRKTRHMSVDEVVREIGRPYEIMFS